MEEVALAKGETKDDSNKEQNNTLIKFIILLLFVIASVVGELFYRQPLFDESIDFELKWRQNAWGFTKTSYNIITNLGGEYGLILYLIIIYFFFPLTESFCFMLGVIACT